MRFQAFEWLYNARMRLLLLLSIAQFVMAEKTVHSYTVEEVTTYFDAVGKVKSESAFLTAVNADGTMVKVDLDPSVGKVRQILDAVRHTNTVVNPAARTASSTPFRMRPEDANRCHERYYAHRGSQVLVDHYAGEIHGVPVVRVSLDDPSGMRSEIDLAPSMGCQMLQTVLRLRGVLIQKMTTRNLRIGPPDPALFTVPADYRRY